MADVGNRFAAALAEQATVEEELYAARFLHAFGAAMKYGGLPNVDDWPSWKTLDSLLKSRRGFGGISQAAAIAAMMHDRTRGRGGRRWEFYVGDEVYVKYNLREYHVNLTVPQPAIGMQCFFMNAQLTRS